MPVAGGGFEQYGQPGASSAAEHMVRRRAATTAEPNAAASHGTPAERAAGKETFRIAQADSRTSAWHHKIGLNDFDAIAIKSRVHFRRGFDDSGFAKTILLVEPEAPFLGTVRLEGRAYESVDLEKFYPYGQPVFP